METTLEHKQMVTTARVTGIWYLILAIAGGIGFLVFHPQIFIANDPQKTLTNLIQLESTARIRLMLELILIVSQALAGLWFYRLFREIKAWAAWGIGIWGTMNSAAIMTSAIAMGAAIDIAGASTPSFEEKTILIQLLSGVITHAWGVGCLFFGLWLIPMGYVVVDSQRMPIWLGRTLMIGGFGYILSAFVKYAGFNDPLVDLLTLPATVGEFWMIGYLLSYGIRPDIDAIA